MRLRETYVNRDMVLGRGEAVRLGSLCLEFLSSSRDIDTMVGHDFHSSLCLAIAKDEGVEARYVVHMAGDQVFDLIACESATTVFVNSKLTLESLASSVGDWVRSKTRVVYFPSPYELRTVERSFRHEPQILILTRYQENKDPGWVLSVLNRVWERGRKFSVVLAGRATELYATRFSYPFLKVLGTLSEEEKIRMIMDSDLVIQPSLYEPYGLIPLEAISLGTPALVSKKAGVSEVVRDGVIDPDNPAETEEVIDKILDPRELRDLLERQRRSEIFNKTWSDVAREILS